MVFGHITTHFNERKFYFQVLATIFVNFSQFLQQKSTILLHLENYSFQELFGSFLL